MGTFTLIVTLCNGVMAIAALIIAIAKPIRKSIEYNRSDNEAIKCLLRTHILNTYLKYKEGKKIPRFERQNMDYLYEAYVARKGNSFVKDIYEEIRDWEIV